jgi:hypothetical protein
MDGDLDPFIESYLGGLSAGKPIRAKDGDDE